MSSENWTKINPYNWDLCEIFRYKDRQCFSYDGKRIIWSDTFEMLKFFTRCFVNQPGNWSAPGGKYKRFCSSDTDLTISWNYGVGSLSFKGKIGGILETLLIQISKIKTTKLTDNILLDPDSPDKDQPSYAVQTTLKVAEMEPGVFINGTEPNCKTASPISDNQTLEQLEDFIDTSYQSTLTHRIAFARNADSSTPYAPKCTNTSTRCSIENKFIEFKQNIESRVAALITKTENQTQIIEKNKQDLCKLGKENLHLKSRLAALERKQVFQGESTMNNLQPNVENKARNNEEDRSQNAGNNALVGSRKEIVEAPTSLIVHDLSQQITFKEMKSTEKNQQIKSKALQSKNTGNRACKPQSFANQLRDYQNKQESKMRQSVSINSPNPGMVDVLDSGNSPATLKNPHSFVRQLKDYQINQRSKFNLSVPIDAYNSCMEDVPDKNNFSAILGTSHSFASQLKNYRINQRSKFSRPDETPFWGGMVIVPPDRVQPGHVHKCQSKSRSLEWRNHLRLVRLTMSK